MLDNINFNFRFDYHPVLPLSTIGTFQNAGSGEYFHPTPSFGTVVFPTGACGLDFCYPPQSRSIPPPLERLTTVADPKIFKTGGGGG